MLGWIFKKRGGADAAAPATATAPKRTEPATPAAPAVDWAAALERARGQDEALLTLAQTTAAPLPFRRAAVEALAGEDALKRAERALRYHDRRVHQLAKQRLQASVAQRRTREQAAQLIATARGLAGQAEVPANRVVELDRAWQALDGQAIEPEQQEAFTALTAELAARLRQFAEIESQHKRWQAEALAALQSLRALSSAAAAGTADRERLVEAINATRGVQAACPPDAAAQVQAELQQALRSAAALDVHLAALDRLQAPGDAEPADDAAADASAPLPAIEDASLEALVQARHARWQQAREQARQDRQAQQRTQARERQRAQQGELQVVLAEALAQAEAALDAGQLADAQRHLAAADKAASGAELPPALQGRLVAAQERLAQLRGWQHWAGGRARDDLVLQAEALAAATTAAVPGPGAPEGDGETAAPVVEEVARLSIRQRADVIDALRQRWKEIDSLGGAGNQALWLRFDAALKKAGEPVAAHLAAQRAAREANLAARLQLLEALEAVQAVDRPLDDASMAPPAEARAWVTSLDRFHAEWRRLGPLEHTVPRAARAGLLERMAAAVQRVERPVQAARVQAGEQRRALVARAHALAAEQPGRGRDLVGEVRALQAEWQQHAKSLPLARADEQALWTEFKAAIDAAFTARDAVQRARDAEFDGHAAERLALIERLRVRSEDSVAVQRRTLAEVDAAWQRCGPAPRARAAALEAEYRAARETLQRWLDDSAQRAWQAVCDALQAKLALCQSREAPSADGGPPDAAALAAAWSAWPELPAVLEAALRRRAGFSAGAESHPPPDVDALLLQIEIDWDLPTPPAFESARRERKLLGLKQALEGRRAPSQDMLSPLAALGQVLGCSALTASQQERLAPVLAAWRRRGPQRAH